MMRQWTKKGMGTAAVLCLAAVRPALAQDTAELQQAYRDYAAKNPIAVQELLAIVKKSPDSVQAHEMLASIYLGQNKLPAAIPELEAVVRLNPKEVAGYRDNLGAAYQQTGDYPKAVRLYQAALLQNPADPTLLFSYAVALDKSGKPAEAAAAFEKAAVLNPKDSKALLYAGLLRHQIGDDTRAVPSLKSALALGTDQKFAACTALAEAAAAAKNTADALRYYTEAGAANPADFMTQANLGILEQNSGDDAAAEASYRRAAALTAPDAKSLAGVQSNMALLLEKQGRKELALAAYKQALTLDANNELAKDGVARLSK